MAWDRMPDDVRNLLTRGQFAAMDKRFGDLQSAYVAGKLPEEDLRNAFRVFYDTDAALDDAYANWVKQSPKSYVAHLARGIHYKFVGIERRGDGWARDTSAEQWAGQKAANKVAAEEFTTSLKLDNKPILTYLHSIDVYADSGDRAAGRRLLEQAIAISPRTFIVRLKYLGTLETKWGGSTEEMRAFVESCRSAGLTQSQMAQLNGMVKEDEGWVRQYHEKNLNGAAESYKQAALLSPERNCVECEPGYKRAALLQETGKHESAIAAITQVLKQHPDSNSALTLRVYSYQALGKHKEARIDITQLASLGDESAQLYLGQTSLARSDMPPDFDDAIKWLTLAANQGNVEAKSLLKLARDLKSRPPIK